MHRLALAMCTVLAGCSYSAQNSQVAPGSQVGGTGDILFDYRQLGTTMHSVVVTVRPGLGETETSMSQRNLAFGTKFAADKCPNGFDFLHNPDPDRPVESGFAQRQKTYSFRCR